MKPPLELTKWVLSKFKKIQLNFSDSIFLVFQKEKYGKFQ